LPSKPLLSAHTERLARASENLERILHRPNQARLECRNKGPVEFALCLRPGRLWASRGVELEFALCLRPGRLWASRGVEARPEGTALAQQLEDSLHKGMRLGGRLVAHRAINGSEDSRTPR